MTDGLFQFHHPLSLNKVTENLTYRLAGIKREIKIEQDDSSESIDDVNDEFFKNMDFKYDPKYIRKKYTFTKKKKPSSTNLNNLNQDKPINIISRHKERLNTDEYFKNVTQKKKIQTLRNLNFLDEETKPIQRQSHSNYNMRESDGYQNIYPFLTEFDYETEKEKKQREHLDSLHLHGQHLVPMSCNKAKLSAKTSSVIENSNDHKIMLYVNQTIVPWKKNSNEIETKHSYDNGLLNTPRSIDTIVEEKPLDAETKFRMTIQKPLQKFVPYNENTCERVRKRTEIKRKATSAIHAIHEASQVSPSMNSNWPSAKQSVVVKKKERTMNDLSLIHI